MLRIAEHVHEVENEKLGWREPKSDGRSGGGSGKTDIYLSQIGGELFGYAAPTAARRPRSTGFRAGCTATSSSTTTTAPSSSRGRRRLEDLQVTLAHEYNHILQFGYDAYQDPWFAESSATWMEDQVYNGIDDYLRYVRRWVQPLRNAADHELDQGVRLGRLEPVAGAPLRGRGRPQGLGAGDPRSARRLLGRRLRARRSARAGRSELSHDFARFAAAVAEWRTGKGFRESGLFPDMPRQGTCRSAARR